MKALVIGDSAAVRAKLTERLERNRFSFKAVAVRGTDQARERVAKVSKAAPAVAG